MEAKTEILEITNVPNSPFQLAKLNNNTTSIICGNYRLDVENEEVEDIAEAIGKIRWDAIGLLMEAYISHLMEDKKTN